MKPETLIEMRRLVGHPLEIEEARGGGVGTLLQAAQEWGKQVLGAIKAAMPAGVKFDAPQRSEDPSVVSMWGETKDGKPVFVDCDVGGAFGQNRIAFTLGYNHGDTRTPEEASSGTLIAPAQDPSAVASKIGAWFERRLKSPGGGTIPIDK
jgi:hypothetical protein